MSQPFELAEVDEEEVFVDEEEMEESPEPTDDEDEEDYDSEGEDEDLCCMLECRMPADKYCAECDEPFCNVHHAKYCKALYGLEEDSEENEIAGENDKYCNICRKNLEREMQ